MALPLAPIAVTALKYGAVAVAAYTASRRLQQGTTDQAHEDVLDNVREGVEMRRARDRNGQLNGNARWRRTVRFGQTGRGLEVDATSIFRLRIRTVD